MKPIKIIDFDLNLITSKTMTTLFGTKNFTGKGRISVSLSEHERELKNNPIAMEEYLKPLNGKRFKERMDPNGKLINMNLVVVNLLRDDRNKILEFDGDEYDTTDEFYPKLNGVKISSVKLTWGQPTGYDNPKFKFWKIMNGY